MVDRTEIDALLISALYGELTPADEARLTAHLESHPADRTALADLTQTRAAVRDSRILSFHFEPPQSVSAMLLREAARRAPRQVSEDAGWFHRFTRSFMAHPAMAAAAMLVLVVGVAGTLYVRHGDLYAPPSLSESAPALTADRTADRGADRGADRVVAASSEAPSGAAAPLPGAPPPSAATPSVATNQAGDVGRYDEHAAGSASFGVGLAEGGKADAKPQVVAAARPPANGNDGFVLDSDRKELRTGKDVGTDVGNAAPAPLPAKPSPAYASKPSKKGSGIEVVRSRELAPKDFDDEQDLAKRSADRIGSATVAKNERAGRGAPGNAGPSGGGATPAPVTVPVLPSPDQPADVAAADAQDPAATSGAKLKAPAPAKTVSRSAIAQSKQQPPAQAAPPPPPPAAAPAAETLSVAPRDTRRPADKAAAEPKSEEKSAEDSLLAWAAQQHRQVIALVGSNKCREAANAAVGIYNRAPGYYAANVATDRSIKPCLAYVTTERERVDRTRAAAKRATAADSANEAPAAPAPAHK
ncbi:MAG: hypothetical protein ABIY55_34230 [Kofleriaceae bacterium]